MFYLWPHYSEYRNTLRPGFTCIKISGFITRAGWRRVAKYSKTDSTRFSFLLEHQIDTSLKTCPSSNAIFNGLSDRLTAATIHTHTVLLQDIMISERDHNHNLWYKNAGSEPGRIRRQITKFWCCFCVIRNYVCCTFKYSINVTEEKDTTCTSQRNSQFNAVQGNTRYLS